MTMDFEGSISSWIGKICEGFDTFCLEAKDILPQKPVKNVQDQLITAAESLKKICFDLNVFSTFKLDSEQGKNSPISAEMEEEIDVHSENKSNDPESGEMEEKMYLLSKDLTKSAEREEKIDFGVVKLLSIPVDDVQPENSSAVSFSKFDTSSSEFPTSPVGSYEEADDISAGSDFEFQVRFAGEDNITKRFNLEELPSEWYMPPDSFEGLEGLYARLMASYTCYVGSRDDKQKSSSISGSKLCTSTQEYALTEDDSCGESGSNSQFENQNPDYSHLLGYDLRDELIKHGFLSPLSGSVQSIISEQSEETEEIDSSSDCVEYIYFGYIDTDATFDNELQSGLNLDVGDFLDSDSDMDAIPDMSDCWSNSKQSPVCDVVVAVAVAVAAQPNLDDNAEIVQDNEWERLDEDVSDEDWEIV